MMTKTRILAITILFLFILTGVRLAWIYAGWQHERPVAAGGVLDLSGAAWGEPIRLDGQWLFYPEQYLYAGNTGTPRDEGVLIDLPGPWLGEFEGAGEAVGYGSYRLLLKLNEPAGRELALALPSVLTASAVYVDGVRAGGAGVPGIDADSTVPSDQPYTVEFTVGGDEVELVLHVANFSNPMQGGLGGSIKLGTESAIAGAQQFSIAMQLLVVVVLLIHVLYAAVLFAMGVRRRALLTLACLMASAALSVLVTDDRLLAAWTGMSYSLNTKLFVLSYIWIAALLVTFVHQLYPMLQKRPWHRYYGAIAMGLTVVVIVLPVQYAPIIDTSTLPLMLGGFLYTSVLALRAALRVDRDAIYLWLGCVALAFNLAWGVANVFSYTLRAVQYYPVDFIIAFLFFAAYWFKMYFRNLQESAQLAAELQKAGKQKQDFLANTSHEMRNPLHSMINIARSVRNDNQLQPASQEKLDLLIAVGKRLALLLNDLLDMDRLQDKGLRLQPEAVQLQAVAAGVIDMIRFMLEGKQLELRNEISEALPPVYADENRLVQILFNLLHNGVKFTEQGHITIRAAIQGKLAVVEVEDTGIGMSPEEQERLFRPYEQGGAGPGAGSGGIGLGLSISRQLAELHGGSLHVRSRPGEGTVFQLALPLAAAAVAGQAGEGATRTGGVRVGEDGRPAAGEGQIGQGQVAAAAVGDRPRVLVVDDDPVNLRVMKGMLPQQYDVAVAYSGHEAMQRIHGEEWDLVVADVMMPRMSGYELTSLIRARFSMSELPVLLLTARSQPEDIAAGFRSGANDYVAKPADSLELQYRVQALTELKRTAEERMRMEAAWLQAQVQPHFLFNTLNSIAALSEINPTRMRSMLEVFGKYLQGSFDFRNSDRIVRLEQELELVRAYLFIEQERFGERLNVEWEVPSHLMYTPVPPLSIQTLAENAVRHGILRQAQGGTVRIEARDCGDAVEIRVTDDGIGIESGQLQELLGVRHLAGQHTSPQYSGIGLRNTDRRLRQLYGRGLEITSSPGSGTTITFRAELP